MGAAFYFSELDALVRPWLIQVPVISPDGRPAGGTTRLYRAISVYALPAVKSSRLFGA
jgi:hypothetical protein